MMSSQTISMLFDYHYGMFDMVWASVKQLTVDQFVEENDYSLLSVRNHLVHCMNVDDRWLARLQELRPPPILDECTYPDQASVRAEWDATRERVLDYVGSQDEGALEATISIELPTYYPTPRKSKRRDALLHMVNHGTDHRAQILARLHELGAPTMEQDLILYLWAQE
ncbi:MAG: DinB family protein [Chloroflexi bacterium]|nr:DinB family protein [Chloroflexota bacterium]